MRCQHIGHSCYRDQSLYLSLSRSLSVWLGCSYKAVGGRQRVKASHTEYLWRVFIHAFLYYRLPLAHGPNGPGGRWWSSDCQNGWIFDTSGRRERPVEGLPGSLGARDTAAARPPPRSTASGAADGQSGSSYPERLIPDRRRNTNEPRRAIVVASSSAAVARIHPQQITDDSRTRRQTPTGILSAYNARRW